MPPKSRQNTPFPLIPPVPGISVRNTDFLYSIFGVLPEELQSWVCLFPGDPADGAWRGFGVRAEDPGVSSILDGGPDLNAFCCFSAFRVGGRRKGLFAGLHAVMLDDIGTGPGAKISFAQLPAISPGWIVETSPGNWQVGYLLRPVVTDPHVAAALLDALVHQGLQAEKDPGMKGVTRYGRMPVGVNGKAKYGGNFRHRLVHWNPGGVYAMADIAAAFKLDLGWIEAHREQVERREAEMSAAVGEDEYLEILRLAVGRVEEPVDKGADGAWCDCTCPWVDEHTGAADNGSAYMLGGGFQCHHGHCIDRTFIDLRSWLEGHSDKRVREAALAAGAKVFEEAPGWWATQSRAVQAPPGEGVGRGYAELEERADKLQPAGTRENDQAVEGLLLDISRSELNAMQLEMLLEKIAGRSTVNKGPLAAMLKAAKKDAEEERVVEKARKRRDGESATTRVGCPVLPVIIPGTWRDADEDRNPLPTSRNVEQLIQEAGGWIRFNRMTGRIECSRSLEGWTADWILQFLADACEINRLKAPGRLIGMIRKIAEEHAYHPFEDYLKSLPAWTGQDWRGALYRTLRVEPGTEGLRDLILRRWTASLVAAGLHLYKGRPGWQPRGVLVFAGEQYTGKTTWLSRLFSGLFAGSERCFLGGAHFSGDTDSMLNVTGALLTELGEIDSTVNRADQGKLKAFLSQSEDRVRKPYGHEHEDRPRRTVFCGTVNQLEFLRDATGNTRFWTLKTEGIDLDAQREIDMHQFWAQVVEETRAELAEGGGSGWAAPWLMSKAEMGLVEAANEPHRVLTEIEEWIRSSFRWDDPEWLALPPGKDRAAINAMTATDLRRRFGETGSGQGGRLSSDWSGTLRKLTGQTFLVKRRLSVRRWSAGQWTGDMDVRVGRFWEMPPPRTINEPDDVFGQDD